MKRTFVIGLAFAAGLAALGGTASAASIAPAISAAMPTAASEDASLITVGMRFRQQKLRGYRMGGRRAMPPRARRFGTGRPRRSGMVVQPGIVTILRYCKRQELLPGGDPRCP